MPHGAHLQSHPRPCRVRVRGRTGDDVWLDGKLFVPGLPDLPAELRKCRIVADFIEIVAGGTDEGQVTFHRDGKVRHSLRGLRALADVVRAAKEGPLQFQVSVDGRFLLAFTVTMPEQPDGGAIEQISNVVACLEKASAGLLPDDLTLSLAEIGKVWNE